MEKSETVCKSCLKLERKPNLKDFIGYELTTISNILSRNSMLRKSNEAAFPNSLPLKINPSPEPKSPKLHETNKEG